MVYKPELQDVAKPQQLRHDDIVMLFMGATGTGKSHFIDTLTLEFGRSSGTSLESVTKYVTGHRIKDHPKYGSSLVCIDTPGFDDTHLSDMEILEMLSDWLVYMHRRNIFLAGIFYLHRITDNRMGGTPLRNLRIFNELCGDTAARSAVLVTTMWDKLPIRTTEGENREESLKKNYWNGMIQRGAFVDRFENTTKSAWDVVGTTLVRSRKNRAGTPLLLQEELIVHRKRLEETRAGRAMYRSLQDHLAKRQEAVQLLIDALKYQNDDNINSQLIDLQSDIHQILHMVDRLHISLGRRIFLFISDKPQARSSKVFQSTTASTGVDSSFSQGYYADSDRMLLTTSIRPRERRLSAGTLESWVYVDPCASGDDPKMEQVEDIYSRIPEKEAEAYPQVLTKRRFDATFNIQHSNDLEVGGFTKPKDEVQPEYQSEEEQLLSDADGEWVEEGPARGRKARKRSTRMKIRSTSRKARSKSARRNVNPIAQLGEIVSRLPTTQGDVYVQIALGPGTYNHACRTEAATAPQVGNVTIYNSNAPQWCPCAHQNSDANGGNQIKDIPGPV